MQYIFVISARVCKWVALPHFFFFLYPHYWVSARAYMNKCNDHISRYINYVCVCVDDATTTRERYDVAYVMTMLCMYTRDMFEWYVLFDDPWLNRFIIVKYFVLKCMSNWVLIFFWEMEQRAVFNCHCAYMAYHLIIILCICGKVCSMLF